MTADQARELRVITWHWREQPDLDEIRNALSDIGGGYLYPADTGCDDYAVVISKEPMVQQLADIAYRKSRS